MNKPAIAVIGSGTMGSGIAQVFAAAGHPVALIDVKPEMPDRARDGIRDSLARLAKKGKLTAADGEAALGRIRTGTDVKAAAGAAFAVEAVVEDVEVKRGVFRALDDVCPAETILASNTSSISITTLGMATRRPIRVVGMHFMNPVPVMPLVEVIRGLDTSDETVRATVELATSLGKTPVEVRDAPGFVSNRVLMPMINEAVYALYEGVASAEAIDTVMKLGMNHPVGPLALADLIGLDTCLAILEVLERDLEDDKFRPCPLLRKKVAEGKLGRKTGEGFYSYANVARGTA